jgi:hypothetical protein
MQGPPGTGKTFTGAHVVRTLVERRPTGGHHGDEPRGDRQPDAQSVVERFETDGDPSACGRAQGERADRSTVCSTSTTTRRWPTGDFNVVAGTPWLFANQLMIDNPVDVLVVDEAGQLGLADTLAASMSATNVILLGDPQQLAQVCRRATRTEPGRVRSSTCWATNSRCRPSGACCWTPRGGCIPTCASSSPT